MTAAMDASHPLWDQNWIEGEGEATIRRHSALSNDTITYPKEVTLYCSWFCPFAQRAWITLEELQVPYTYVEVNPYRVDPNEPGGYTKQSLSMQEKRDLMPDFMNTSPRGLVPAIQDVRGERIWESAVVIEYLDQVYGDNRLYTKGAQMAAMIRIYIDHCSSRIQKSYYRFLMETTRKGRIEAKIDFFRECRALACAMAPNATEPTPEQIQNDTQKEEETIRSTTISRLDVGTISMVSQEAFASKGTEPGPFFLGKQFSAVDIALVPFWQRVLWVGQHYRDLILPTHDDAAFVRLQQWWEAVSERASVARTFVGKQRLISSYKQYAQNVATSDWANTMQSNMSTKDDTHDDDDDDDNNNITNKRPKV